jgi:ribonuclease D
MQSPTRFVTHPAALTDLCAALAEQPALALDTEFMRERTYRAELCLVQIGWPSGAVCVDPIALESVAPLAAPLGAATSVKVLHAARQDLEVLLPAVGAIGSVFDTQVAAALTGLPAQIGYGELTRRLLEVELAKAYTRADWSKRPLSDEQIEYALDDVRYLLPLRERLLETLDRLNRLAWLDEELAPLSRPMQASVDPDRAWQRLKGLQGLDDARLALARSLAAWRERRAIDRNRPRGWILDDSGLRGIVLRVPRTAADLATVPDLTPGFVERSAEAVLGVVEEARMPHSLPPPSQRPRPDAELQARVKRLGAIVQEQARALALAPELLATRRDLEGIARGKPVVETLSGWRATVLADALSAAV